jgi:hypothetical protein
MKTLTTAITLLATLLLASSGLLVTHAATSNSVPQQTGNGHALSLNLQGFIQSAGDQTWSMSGGSLIGAQIGQEVVPAGTLYYSMRASVNGLSSSGWFQLSTSGTTTDGQSVTFNANGPIVGMIPSICFPSYASPDAAGNCQTTDTSAIPGFFEAAVSATETVGSTTTPTQLVLLIEAPIMTPWGGPVVISSTDGSVNIVASYQSGTATWTNVQLAGTLSGTYNGQPASGSFMQVANARENFVSGTESEFGTVAFAGMSPSSLNAQGLYAGSSTVPTTGSYDCSALAGLPEGTCTETGLTSTGAFVMMGAGSTITGTYAVNWPAPSVTCSGTITATVTHNSGY